MNWPQILLIGFLAGAIIGGSYLWIADIIAIKRAVDKEFDARFGGDDTLGDR